ncbi:MAG: Fe-Mn family superoxide dismutase [Candidatus Algichlamydia australiensis]|nr:Fe-Mn family superoxide dismutase [Chlamydiales bacterium]
MKKFFLILVILALSSSVFADYKAKDYSYLLGHVKGLDDSLLKMHFTLYQGYVKNTNSLLATIEELSKSGKDRTAAYGALKRRVGWEMDGMLLHELYFSNLGGKGNLDSNSPLYKAIVSDFGSYESWKKDYIATGMMRGIGWVILYRDPKNRRLQNIWIEEHDLGHIAGGTPILIMDVWEHAYITQFGLDRAGYINTFFQNINWKEVEQRVK